MHPPNSLRLCLYRIGRQGSLRPCDLKSLSIPGKHLIEVRGYRRLLVTPLLVLCKSRRTYVAQQAIYLGSRDPKVARRQTNCLDLASSNPVLDGVYGDAEGSRHSAGGEHLHDFHSTINFVKIVSSSAR